MSQSAVMLVGKVQGPAKAWLVGLLGPSATDDAEVRISLKRPVNSIPDRKWTPELNDRRCDLVDLEFAAGLSAEEEIELADLTDELERFIDHAAPFPLDEIRAEHKRLVELAARSEAEV